jgi:hypothetical protein
MGVPKFLSKLYVLDSTNNPKSEKAVMIATLLRGCMFPGNTTGHHKISRINSEAIGDQMLKLPKN